MPKCRQTIQAAWTFIACLSFGVAAAPAAEDMKAPGSEAVATGSATTKGIEKKAPLAKLYRYKGQKTSGTGDAQATVLQVEDLVSGRSDTVYVAGEASAAVIDALKDLEPGTPIEILTERQKGKTFAVGINKSPLAPGEDRPNVYVLVEWDKKKQQDGKPVMAVKLRKFGREFTAFIPLTHNRQTDDWQAPGSVEDTLGKVQPGGVLEAVLATRGPNPIVRDLVLYRPPEQGKFVEFTQHEMQGGATAAAFKMVARDGVTVTVTLPGVERVVKGTKVLAPDPNQLRKVQSIKPDSEVEITLMPGDQYILRDIKVLSKPGTAPDGKKS